MFTSNAHISDALLAAGIVDTHYHVGPELVKRRYNVKTLAEAAKPFNAALVLKNHTYSTTPLAALARAEFGATFYGGVVLNSYVGGLNPEAIIGAVSGNKADVTAPVPDPCPVVVWMPTVDAVSHIRTFGFGFDPKWSGCCSSHHDCGQAEAGGNTYVRDPVVAFTDGLKPTKALLDVLKAIADHSCVLATGHLCAAEVVALVPLALDAGVQRIILTHPHYPSVRLGDEDLRQLIKLPGVYIEHCFAIHTQDGIDLREFSASILATGPERVILSTDFGQINSAAFPDGTIAYAREMSRLLDGKISRADFLGMFSENGRKALGLV